MCCRKEFYVLTTIRLSLDYGNREFKIFKWVTRAKPVYTSMPKRTLTPSKPNTLQLRKGVFTLVNVESEKVRRALYKNSRWKPIGDDCFETAELGAAVKYREIADARVEKIFQKSLQAHYPLPYIPPLPKLDAHQYDGIRFILSRKRSYLAHPPGAGKTAQAILAACLRRGFDQKCGQTLFIVPPSLAKNWEREILKFTEWLDIFPTIGRVRDTEKQGEVAWGADFVIVPDSMLAKDWVYQWVKLIPWQFIAVDEASRFKDPLAQRSIAFYGGIYHGKSYQGIFQKARHVVFLDGSPMPNRPMELWAPCYALHPESIDFLNREDFGYRYCGAKLNPRTKVWEFLHSSNEKELHDKINRDFMHRVPETALDHPERRRRIVYLDDVRSKEHRAWDRRFLSDSFEPAENSSQGDMAHWRRELGLRKIQRAVTYIEDCLEKDEPLIVFAWHREVVTGLAEKLLGVHPLVVMGGMGMKEQNANVEAFQNGDTDVLIMNIAAGGRGYNIQRAKRVIFVEFSWTDETNKQAEKRASRKGSAHSHVLCDYLVSANTVDEIVMRSVFTKETRVRRVIG